MSHTPPADPATVLIVEDDQPTRDRLARAVSSHERLTLMGTCDSVAEAVRLITTRPPVVLLTDLGLPDGNGIGLIRMAKARGAQAMVVTIFGDEETVIRAIEAGASGYLLKDDHPRAIGDAIVEMVEGGAPISPAIARLLLRRVAAGASEQAPVVAADQRPPGLTAREREVLNLVAKGFSFGEIAKTLSVSPHTVTSHVRHIYEKLEVGSRGEAVFEAVQQGLIRLQE